MRIFHLAILAFATLAACGGGGNSNPDAAKPIDAAIDAPPDAKPPVDAFVADLSCINDPPAAAGTNPILIMGNTLTLQGMSSAPVEGADVKAFKISDPKVSIASATSAADGTFTLTLANPTLKPIDGFVEAAKAGLHTTRIFPPNPLAADLPMAPIPMLSDALFALIKQFTGIDQDPANGAFAIGILDCKNQPIPNVTLSVKQGANEVGQQLDASQFQAGTFFVFNVPPGNNTVVSATAMGMDLHAHIVTSTAGTTTATFITPRP